MEAPGLTKAAEIDSANRLVTLSFDETVDITNVQISSYTLSEGASIVSGNLDAPIELLYSDPAAVSGLRLGDTWKAGDRALLYR